jgi:hypothetical protein
VIYISYTNLFCNRACLNHLTRIKIFRVSHIIVKSGYPYKAIKYPYIISESNVYHKINIKIEIELIVPYLWSSDKDA